MSLSLDVDKSTLSYLDADVAWHYQIIPKAVDADSVSFYVDEKCDLVSVQNELELLEGKKVELFAENSDLINEALNRYYIRKQSSQTKINIAGEEGFVDRIIKDAHVLGCSDIHIETFEEQKRVRFRLDGQLIQRYVIPEADYSAIINKIKIMANMDISEKRLPQDGRILYSKNDLRFDIRVSSLPTMIGEKIVLRLLGTDASKLDITKIGMTEQDLQAYLKAVTNPNGIVLISGPTGSGKTTTLYATLGHLNEESKNILTIEDPIEYTLTGINQVQLKEGIGLNFGKALRTFLRQDPDIIMVGEIRDEDTANMAVRAALTGHLVLSTIHTNSAWGIIARLLDMKIPPYLLASTLNAAVAQRLVRKLCNHCKVETSMGLSDELSDLLGGYPLRNHYMASGCNECFHTGYSGRVAIYEVITIDKQLTDDIKSGVITDVSAYLKSIGSRSLAENARELLTLGITSFEEVSSIISNTK